MTQRNTSVVGSAPILTITWVDDDVRQLAKQYGIDPDRAIEAVRDSRRQLEERSIEYGWEVIGFILDDCLNDDEKKLLKEGKLQ
jgi:hypothetical protein